MTQKTGYLQIIERRLPAFALNHLASFRYLYEIMITRNFPKFCAKFRKNIVKGFPKAEKYSDFCSRNQNNFAEGFAFDYFTVGFSGIRKRKGFADNRT